MIIYRCKEGFDTMNKQEERIKLNREIERVKKEIYKSGCKDVKLINQYSRLVDKMIKLM